MKYTIAIASLLFVASVIFVSAQGKTTLDGIYSEPQAARGEKVYATSCASCHGDDLSGGGQTPALAGKDFNTDWADLTMGDLFDRTQGTMPADKPGTMTPAQTADVLAYLLKKGSFPAGAADLPGDPVALKAMKFVSAPAPK
jgi:S-disulfanyl-L-cysteine oxidoreductase SoxD